MRHCWPYPYVSHLLDLPPEVAELHLDLTCVRLAAGEWRSHTTGRPALEVRNGRLELDRGSRPVERRRAYLPWRALQGTLHPAGWWTSAIAVDLELLPWSATRSELALIAGPARRSGRIGERRYLRLAHDVLDLLVSALRTAGDDHRLHPVDGRRTTGIATGLTAAGSHRLGQE